MKNKAIRKENLRQILLAYENYDSKKVYDLLMSNIILPAKSNKMRFLRFSRYMTNCMKNSSEGKITHKWKIIEWMKKKHICVQFYDEVHTFPRMTIIMNRKGNNYALEVLPL